MRVFMREEESRWNLDDIIKENEIEGLIANVERKVCVFENYRKLLKPSVSAGKINEMLSLSEDIAKLMNLIGDYAGLGARADVKNQRFIALGNRISEISADSRNRRRFFSLWWKGLDDANAERIIRGLRKNRYAMKSLRKWKKYSLKEEEERIITLKDVYGETALVELYNILSDKLTFKWRGRTLTRSEMKNLVFELDQKGRSDAFKVMADRYGEVKEEMGYILQKIVADFQKETIDLRGFRTALSETAMRDDIPESVITLLIDVCKDNEHVFRDYFRLKKKVLGLRKLYVSDLSAPYAISKKKVTYDNAKNTVLSIFEEFSPEFRRLASNVLEHRHIDYKPRPNKYSGAFCVPSPFFVPYLLMNFDGHEENIASLMHELGHCINGQLASRNTLAEYQPPMPLAETASIFSEFMFYDHMLANAKNKKERISRLVSMLNKFSGAIQRQIRHTSFEIELYEKVRKSCTFDEIDAIWMKNMKEGYGNSVIVPDYYKEGWMRIPHFYFSHFYSYSYAFANLLVLSLFRKYRKEGASFVPKFRKMLSYGGSKPPVDILKEVGIDIKDRKFWEGGFEMIEEYVDELRKLA
jgi:oligoendopeptidase F